MRCAQYTAANDMGDQVRCTVSFDNAESAGTAHLETETLVFRGAFRLSIPFGDITAVRADGGQLSVAFAGGTAVFQLGPKAQRWASAIAQPKSVIDKLGIKPGMRVGLVDVDDAGFRERLAGLVEVVGGRAMGCDLIFLGAPSPASLRRLETLQRHLKPNGAIWVLRPKKSPDISEMEVLDAGRAAALVDTKVVAFSPILTAHKFVIPVARRAAASAV